MVLKPKYDVGYWEEWSEGVIPVSKTEGEGVSWNGTRKFYMAYMDRRGNLGCEFIEAELSRFVNGYALIMKNYPRRYGLIDTYGNIILPCKYSFVCNNWDNNDGLVGVETLEGASSLRGKSGFYNTLTRTFTIPLEYDGLSYEFHEGMVYAERNDKYGFLNKEGNVVIPFIYDRAWDFSEGFAVVKRYGKYGYVDRYGNDTFNY